MNRKISKRDWETISAYLDGQLTTNKQSRLESRLQQEPHLLQAFNEMRETRHILRNTPRLRSPRNFLLTPQMAGKQAKMPRLAPVFGWASAAASLILILVLVGDIFNPGGMIPTSIDQVLPPFEPAASSEVSLAPIEEPAAMDSAAAGGFSEPAESEVTQEVAAAPEMQAAALDESETSLKEATEESETVVSESQVEEPVATPSISSGAAPAAETTPYILGAPAETESTVIESDQTEEPEYVEGGILSDVVSTETITPTMAATQLAENLALQPTEVLGVEEAGLPSEGESVPEAPSLRSEAPVPESMEMEVITPESLSEEGVVQEEPADIFLGVEVILALMVAGFGIAWSYLRRRGG